MIHFWKIDGQLKPAYASDVDAWSKIKEGKMYCMRYKSDRNYLHHKKLFAIAKLIIDNLPEGHVWEGKPPYILIKSTELELGYFEPVLRMNGKIEMQPESIDFEHWGQEKFEQFYEDTLNYWCTHFGFIREDLENNLD
jgi:hypothetical protein